MEDENIYSKLTDILQKMGGKYSILEEEIDVDTQMEYFEYSKNFKHSRSLGEILGGKNDLLDIALPEEDKKRRLVELAAIDDIDAFKAIGVYLEKESDQKMRAWGILAYQESKMLLESRLLDENQIFISTGLGGKGNKFRYFVVFFPREEIQFTEFQQELVKKELSYALGKCNSEVEESFYSEAYITVSVLIPLDIAIKEVFERVIAECNQMGDFINDDYIVTNIKKLTDLEIEEFLSGEGEDEMENGKS